MDSHRYPRSQIEMVTIDYSCALRRWRYKGLASSVREVESYLDQIIEGI